MATTSFVIIVAVMAALGTAQMDWTYTAPALQWGAVDVRNGLVWAATDDAVLALDPASGKFARRYGPHVGLAAQPSFFNSAASATTGKDKATSMLLPTDNGTSLTFVDIATGKTRWVVSLQRFQKQHPVVRRVSCAGRFFTRLPSEENASVGDVLLGRCGMVDTSNLNVVLLAVSAADGALLWAEALGLEQAPNFPFSTASMDMPRGSRDRSNFMLPARAASTTSPKKETSRVSYFLDPNTHAQTVTARTAINDTLWSFSPHGTNFLDAVTTVAVCGDVVAVMTAHGVFGVTGAVIGLHLNGTKLWMNTNAGNPLWGPPACVKTSSPNSPASYALVGLFNNTLVKLNVANGSTAFSVPMPTGQFNIEIATKFLAVDEMNGRIIVALGVPWNHGQQIAISMNAFDLSTGALQNTILLPTVFKLGFAKSIAVLPGRSTVPGNTNKTAVFFAQDNQAYRLTI